MRRQTPASRSPSHRPYLISRPASQDLARYAAARSWGATGATGIMTLGPTIAQLRKERGLKQVALANKAGLSPSYLSRLEAGLRDPTVSSLEAVAGALDIPLPVLFFLSISEEDVPAPKRDAYQVLYPALRSLVDGVFGTSDMAPVE